MADALTEQDKNTWAYLQGRTAGFAGEKTERGIMAFGLGFAADAVIRRNTQLWLAGFDSAEAEKELESVKVVTTDSYYSKVGLKCQDAAVGNA